MGRLQRSALSCLDFPSLSLTFSRASTSSVLGLVLIQRKGKRRRRRLHNLSSARLLTGQHDPPAALTVACINKIAHSSHVPSQDSVLRHILPSFSHRTKSAWRVIGACSFLSFFGEEAPIFAFAEAKLECDLVLFLGVALGQQSDRQSQDSKLQMTPNLHNEG